MDIINMLSIGNNEKCPHCERIITEETDVLKHFIYEHPVVIEELLSVEGDK